MMWISVLLVLFFGSPTYWDQVEALNSQGCKVYDDFYISCPGVVAPPSAFPIPEGAVEVVPQIHYPKRSQQRKHGTKV